MMKKTLELDQIKEENIFEQVYFCLIIGWLLLLFFMLLMSIFHSNIGEHIYAYIDFYGVFFLFYAMVTVTFYVFTSTAYTRTLLLKYNSKKVEIALFGTLVSLCLLLTGILFIGARDLAMENILPLLLLLSLRIFPVRKKITLFADIIIPLVLFLSFIYGWLQGKSAWWGFQEVVYFLDDSLVLFFIFFLPVIMLIEILIRKLR